MKNNFSKDQFNQIANTFNNNFTVRVNKCGNIEVVYNLHKDHNEKFVLYLQSDGNYLWRKICSGYYCYPLNMKNRKKFIPIIGSNHQYYDYKANCEFDTVDKAIEYIKMYFCKYHKISL